jgi:hypothetical protein
LEEFHVQLRARIAGWPRVAESNVRDLGEGWQLAEEVADLHGLAVQRLSNAAGRTPNAQDESLMLLGTHGLNMFIGASELICKGQFDVASHLMRGIFDCESLLYAVASGAERADRFMNGDLRSHEGRRLVVDAIRSADPELASFMDGRFKDEFDAANEMSHVNLTHVDKLLQRDGDSIMPVVGGRPDRDLARRMFGAVLEHEHWHLTWFAAFRRDVVGEDWYTRYVGTRETLRSWMKEVFGKPGYRDAQSGEAR